MNVHKDRVFGRERAMRRIFPGLLRFSGQTPRKAFAPLEFLLKLQETGHAGVSFAAVGVDDMQCFLQNTCINREER